MCVCVCKLCVCEVGEDDLDEDVALAMVLQNTAGTEVNASAGPSRANSKTCVCGGTDHLRRSSMLCPLNKRHSK